MRRWVRTVASLVLRDYSAVEVETELDGLFGFGGNVLTLSVSAATVGVYSGDCCGERWRASAGWVR